jgi:hypothetical protein
VTEQNILRRILGGIADRSDITQIDRLPSEHPDNHPRDLLFACEKPTGFDQNLLILCGQSSRMKLAIGLAQHGHEARRTQSTRRQLDQVQLHPHLSTRPTHKRGFSHPGNLLDGIIDLSHDAPQHLVIVPLAMEGQRQNRHIIDGSGLDEWEGNAGRNAVNVGSQFLREPHQACLGIGTDLEANDGQGLRLAAGGIHVFYSGDFPQEFLHRPRGTFLHLTRRKARH